VDGAGQLAEDEGDEVDDELAALPELDEPEPVDP
jgi:hypothetical protein